MHAPFCFNLPHKPGSSLDHSRGGCSNSTLERERGIHGACRYICTLMGRRRYLDMINNGNSSDQAKAERQAVNSLPQGSAADLIKMAMLRLHSVISGRPIPPLPSLGQEMTPAAEETTGTAKQGQSERCTPSVLPVGSLAEAGGRAGQGDSRSVGESAGVDFVPGQPSIGGARTAAEARDASRFYHLAGRCRLLLQVQYCTVVAKDATQPAHNIALPAANLLSECLSRCVQACSRLVTLRASMGALYVPLCVSCTTDSRRASGRSRRGSDGGCCKAPGLEHGECCSAERYAIRCTK